MGTHHREGLAAARARSRMGGRKFSLIRTQVLGLAQAMNNPAANHQALARVLGIAKMPLFRFVSPTGELRESGKKVQQG